MIKVFISQPMRDKTKDEILSDRNKAINEAKILFCKNGEQVQVLDSVFEDAPKGSSPLWYLAKALELLSEADVAIFTKGWNNYRGCRIEHTCAMEYGIGVIEL